MKLFLSTFSFISFLIPLSQTSFGLAEDYLNEVTPLVSAPELNLLYGSIPHGHGESFRVLGSFRQSDTSKFFLLERVGFNGQPISSEKEGEKNPLVEYLIVGTTSEGSGIEFYYQGEQYPFPSGWEDNGGVELESPLELEVLRQLYISHNGFSRTSP